MKAEAELTAAQEELRQLKLHHAALMRGHGKRIADEIRATIYPDERACQAAEIAESTIPEEIQ
jgi:hypothetical protein